MPSPASPSADFRSYADAVLAPGPGFVILTGENGAGKTNLLEAVSLLSPGRGLRGAALGEMARRDGAGGFAVAARVGEIDIGTGTTAAAPERRQVRINGAPAAANALPNWLSVLWLTPAMDRLFADSRLGPAPLPRPAGARARPGPRHATPPATRRRCARATNCSPKRGRGTRPGSRAGGADGRAWRRDRRGRAPATVAALASGWRPRPKGRSPAPALALDGGDAPARSRAGRRARRRRRPHAGRARTAPTSLVTHVGKSQPAVAVLDRRAEGAADRPDPRPCRSRRRAHRPPPDPAARRDRRPSRSRAAAPPCSSGSARPAARSG